MQCPFKVPTELGYVNLDHKKNQLQHNNNPNIIFNHHSMYQILQEY